MLFCGNKTNTINTKKHELTAKRRRHETNLKNRVLPLISAELWRILLNVSYKTERQWQLFQIPLMRHHILCLEKNIYSREFSNKHCEGIKQREMHIMRNHMWRVPHYETPHYYTPQCHF